MNILRTTIVLLILSSTAVFAQNEVKTTLDSFDEIKGFDQLRITLIKSDRNEAIITGHDTDKVKFDNDNGLLKVRMEIEKFLDGNETNVTIYHSNDLKLIDVNEGAKISSKDEIDTDYLTIRAQEGGQLDLNIDADNLDVKAVTGGIIKVYGEADNQDVLIRTGGEYRAKDLESDNVDITIVAGGEASINAEDFVNASVNAGGIVEIYGNPKQVKENKTMGGSIVLKK